MSTQPQRDTNNPACRMVSSSSSPISRPVTSTSPSRAMTTTCAGFTPTLLELDTAATATPASDPVTNMGTTPRSCSTPTATTSKSSTTTASGLTAYAQSST